VIKAMTSHTPGKKSLKIPKAERVNQNLYIEEEQTTQWPKEKVQKDKQHTPNQRLESQMI
jgi:phage FluMu protein Com